MKGQYFSFDAIIASVIFVLALVALLSYWHSVKSFLDYQNDPLSKEAIRVSNLLLSPSTPDFNSPAACDKITSLGFAMSWSDRRINTSILDCASKQDEGWIMGKLGTQYKVYLKFSSASDPTTLKFTAGVDPKTQSVPVSEQVNLRRVVTLVDSKTAKTELASMDLVFYK